MIDYYSWMLLFCWCKLRKEVVNHCRCYCRGVCRMNDRSSWGASLYIPKPATDDAIHTTDHCRYTTDHSKQTTYDIINTTDHCRCTTDNIINTTDDCIHMTYSIRITTDDCISTTGDSRKHRSRYQCDRDWQEMKYSTIPWTNLFLSCLLMAKNRRSEIKEKNMVEREN